MSPNRGQLLFQLVLTEPAGSFTRPRYQLNEIDAARAVLASGAEIGQTKLPKLENGDLGGSWLDWIIAQALLREAKGWSKPTPMRRDQTRSHFHRPGGAAMKR